ncbi:MAG: hypothetical protein IT204_04425 [Fimbriimonadaceae bacterium]|nr:hypothetical protein [Fimbriimonadaceae bacterium]
MMLKRLLKMVLGLSLLALLSACGEGVAGSQRETRNEQSISDNTQLADGSRGETGKAAQQDTTPRLPLLRDLQIRGETAYALLPEALALVSLADPAKPVLVSRQVVAKTPRRLVLDGPHAFIACDAGGLQVVAVGQPLKLSVVGTYAPQAGSVSAVAVRNGLAVVLIPGTGAAVLDVSDPAQPQELKVVPLKGTLSDVAIGDDRALVLGTELSLISLSKPKEAAVVGTWSLKEALWALAPRDGFTALLGAGGLRLLNLTVPERPQRTAELTLAALDSALTPAPVETAAAGHASGAALINVEEAPAKEPASAASADAAAAPGTSASPATAATPGAAQPAAAADPAKAATPAEAPFAPRLVAAGERLFVLRSETLDAVLVVDTKQLRPAWRLSGAPQPRCLAVAGDLLAVGQFDGELSLWRLGAEAPTRLGSLALANQEPANPPAAATPAPPAPKESVAAMLAAPQPTTARPAGAPRP